MAKRKLAFAIAPQDLLAHDLSGCGQCETCHGLAVKVVASGDLGSRLIFAGAGPFGQSGPLLDRMIEAMGLKKEQVAIYQLNGVSDQTQPCTNFLPRPLGSFAAGANGSARVVVALGEFAAHTLLQSTDEMSALRGEFHPYRDALLIPTFHPAYLLSHPEAKKEAWADLQKVAKQLGIQIPSRK